MEAGKQAVPKYRFSDAVERHFGDSIEKGWRILDVTRGKQADPKYRFSDAVEHCFGDSIDKDWRVLDEEALTGEIPTIFPSLPEDPAERKKVITKYFKRLNGAAMSFYAQAAKNIRARQNALISSSSPSDATGNIATTMGAGLDELKINDCNLQKRRV